MRDRRGAPTPKRGAGAESPTPPHVAIAECGGGMPKYLSELFTKFAAEITLK